MPDPVDLAALAAQLVARAGRHDADVWGDGTALAAAAARMEPHRNAAIRLAKAATLPGVTTELHAPRSFRVLPPPVHPGAMPAWFTARSHEAMTEDVHLVRIPGGHLLHLAHAPVLLTAAADTVLQDVSGRYAPLVHHVECDLAAILRDARHVPGCVFVLGDEIAPLNYCHWLTDALPRLDAVARLRATREVTVAVRPLTAAFQRETLHLCGYDDAHILELGPMQALRADELLATSDLPAPPHPAFKASAWALRFLRRHLSPAGGQAGVPRRNGRRLYVSRNDSGGRRIVNESELIHALRPLGVETVTLAGRTVREQASLFAEASFVVAPHGAALANIAFAPRGAGLLELFPRSYGMASYYVLAAGAGIDYAYGIVDSMASGSRAQLDDMRVDVTRVAAACRDMLR